MREIYQFRRYRHSILNVERINLETSFMQEMF